MDLVNLHVYRCAINFIPAYFNNFFKGINGTNPD
jgi:hypothetical protein